MTDKDREAFEQVAGAYFPHGPIHPALYRKKDGEYFHVCVSDAWHGWQASRDHYAPKLTEKEATEAIKNQVFRLDNVIKPNSAHGSGIVAEYAIAALRAAGIRFREEA